MHPAEYICEEHVTNVKKIVILLSASSRWSNMIVLRFETIITITVLFFLECFFLGVGVAEQSSRKKEPMNN